MTILDWLCEQKIIMTHAEARRLLHHHSILVNDTLITNLLYHIYDGDKIQICKKIFYV